MGRSGEWVGRSGGSGKYVGKVGQVGLVQKVVSPEQSVRKCPR